MCVWLALLFKSHNLSDQCSGSSMNPFPCPMRHKENVPVSHLCWLLIHEDGCKQQKPTGLHRSQSICQKQEKAKNSVTAQHASVSTCSRECLNPERLKIGSLTRTHLILVPIPMAAAVMTILTLGPLQGLVGQVPPGSSLSLSTLSQAAYAGRVHLSCNFILATLFFQAESSLQCL